MLSAEKKDEDEWPTDWRRHRPLLLTVITMLTIIAWLLFILFYVLCWSTWFTLFPNAIVTIVSLGIAALVAGMCWAVSGSR